MEPINDYKNVYIYKKMTPECGYAILNGYLTINYNDLSEIKPVVWIIRESNQDGMLTIDYATFDQYRWDNSSCRFLLTSKGWIVANKLDDPEVQNARNSMINIDSKLAKEYLPQWENFIETSFKLDKNYRINPKLDEQTTNAIYSDYGDVLKNKVILNPGITQAISCEITREPFKEPVIMKNDLQIDKAPFKLYKGRTYEKSALIKLKIMPEVYCPNLTLKEVVNRLGSLIKEKIETLTEDKLTDSIFFELMENPVILPSGKSISETTWYEIQKSSNKCPHTRNPLGEILPNDNLRAFIDEWVLYKETFIEKLG